MTAEVVDYPIPIFFSETGCNVPDPRTFQDQIAIFGTSMAPYWSGAIIYEWIQEDNHYGLITYGGGNTDSTNSATPVGGISYSGTPTPVTPDFANLMSVWSQVAPISTASAAVTTNAEPSCPAYTASIWEVSGAVALPTLGAAAVVAQTGTGVTSATTASSGTSVAGSTAATTGTTTTKASTSGSTTGTSTKTSTSASASATKASGASGEREIVGVAFALTSVLLGFVWWL